MKLNDLWVYDQILVRLLQRLRRKGAKEEKENENSNYETFQFFCVALLKNAIKHTHLRIVQIYHYHIIEI